MPTALASFPFKQPFHFCSDDQPLTMISIRTHIRTPKRRFFAPKRRNITLKKSVHPTPKTFQTNTGETYDLQERVGNGGSAQVWTARAPNGELVALKLYVAEAPRSLSQREFEVGELINHPNVIGITNTGTGTFEHRQCFFTLMEFVPGFDLQQISLNKIFGLRMRRKIDLEGFEITTFLRQLLLGLGAIHQAGFTHREIIPVNLRITTNGQLKILDLATCHPISSSTQLNYMEDSSTFSFLSPENTGETKFPLGPYTDLYSVGRVLMYLELLCGFELPKKISLLISKLIIPEPHRRVQSVAEALQLLA